MGQSIQPGDLRFTTREYYLANGDDYSYGQTLSFEQLDTTLIFLSNSIATSNTSFVGLTTASVSLNTIYFSKSNGTTFNIKVDTGSGQTYTAGDGIDINGSNVVSSKILTVNSIGPDNGNISLSITNTITGLSSSLSGSPFFLPDTYSPRPPVSGTIFVVSGETDGNVDKNGNAYIFVTSSTQAGSWQQIFGFNETTADARYVKLASNTTQNISSSLNITGSVTFLTSSASDRITFSSSLYWLSGSHGAVTPGSGVTSSVVVLGNDGRLYITGAYGSGGGGPANPGSPANSIQYNNNNTSFGGSANLTFNGTNTVNLTGSLITSGSTPLQVIGAGSVTGSLSISRSIDGTPLTVIGTGSSPILNVVGSTGNLLQAYDKVSGDIFTVGDYPSGLPILRVTSNKETFIGNSNAPGLYTSFITSSVNVGQYTIYSFPTSSYNAAWIDYVVISGSNFRAGTVSAVWSGSSATQNDISSSRLGPNSDTSAISFDGEGDGGNINIYVLPLQGNGWTIKTIIKAI